MTVIEFERTVPHTPEQMFDLVWNLDEYPSFVPNCSDVTITKLPANDECLARMHISFGPISQSYESKVIASRDTLTITASSRDDPFAFLESTWKFSASGKGARVDFVIDFQIRNRTLARIAEPLFAKKQRDIIDAFITRAEQLYGSH